MDLEGWAVSLMEKHNRKSHLARQLSPVTQAFLKNSGVETPSRDTDSSRTPKASEIPIAGVNGGVAAVSSTSKNASSTDSRHPGHPPRTSSAPRIPTNGPSMNLPMRPAPPPAGPLPNPPGSLSARPALSTRTSHSGNQDSRDFYD